MFVNRNVLRHAGAFLVGATLLSMVIWNHGISADLIIDVGREVYVPWQIASGSALYEDISYFNGPLSPLMNAAMFAVFGAGLQTLMIVNGVVLVVIAGLLYQLVNAMAGRVAAAVAGVVFAVCFATTFVNYNYLSPYSHEMTHGCALALCALWAISRYGRAHAPIWLAVVGAALGGVFLTKAELFVAVALAVVPCVILVIPQSRRWGSLARIGAGFASVIAIAFVYLAARSSVDVAVTGVAGSWIHIFNVDVRSLPFYRQMTGLDDVGGNLAGMFTVGAALAGASAMALLVGVLVRGSRLHTWIAAALVAPALCAAGRWVITDQQWLAAASALPLVSAVALTVVVVRMIRARRAGEDATVHVAALGFVLFGGGLLAKMMLAASFDRYGFVLTMPATMTLVVIMVAWLPAVAVRLGGSGGVTRSASLGLLAAALLTPIQIARVQQERRPHTFGTAPNTLRVTNNQAAIEPLLTQLDDTLPDDATVLVFPEGVMLNVMLGRRNPTPFFNFMPPEMAMFGEQAMIDALESSPPDVIVRTGRNTAEYGVGQFGQGYAVELMQWISRNYRDEGGPADQPIRILWRRHE